MSMENEMPLVSVITPAYNRASFLDETVLSVLNQDYPNIEYIILDDGSTDETLEVIKKYSDKILLDAHENMGETRTVNKGFSMAKGEIVVVVNSDDPLLRGAVSTAVSFMRKYPDALAFYPDWIEIGPNSEFIKQVELPNYDLVNMLTTFNVAMGPGTFIRHKAFDLAGMRDPKFKYAGDLEFWFRLALNGTLVHIPKTLATHRTHPESASVSDRGPRMANELVMLTQKIFSHQGLSLEIHKLRSKVFSIMHFEAARYCGPDTRTAIKHHLNSFRYDPLYYLLRASTHSLLPKLPSPIYSILRSIWHINGPCRKVRHRLSVKAGLSKKW